MPLCQSLLAALLLPLFATTLNSLQHLAAAEARAQTSSASVRDLAGRLRSLEEEKQSLTLRLAESSTELAEVRNPAVTIFCQLFLDKYLLVRFPFGNCPSLCFFSFSPIPSQARAAHSRALTQLRQLQAAATSSSSCTSPELCHAAVQVEEQVTVQHEGEEAVQMSVRELTEIVVEQQQTIALMRREKKDVAVLYGKHGGASSASTATSGAAAPAASTRVFVEADGAIQLWLPDLAGTPLLEGTEAAEGTEAKDLGSAVWRRPGPASAAAAAESKAAEANGPPSIAFVWQTRVAALVNTVQSLHQKLAVQARSMEELRAKTASSIATKAAAEAAATANGSSEAVKKLSRRLERAAAEAERARWREKQVRAELAAALQEQKGLLGALARAREEVSVACSGHRADAALWDAVRATPVLHV